MADLKFRYIAQTSEGKQVKGLVEASTETKAYHSVKSKGLIPLKIMSAESGLQMEIELPWSKKTPKTKALALWSKQMAVLLKAGMPLIRALAITAEQAEDKILVEVLHEVYADVENGMSLSGAMAIHEDAFSPLMINLIKVGESGGFLEKSLMSISGNLKADMEIRGKVKSAMIYPVIVGIIAILAVAAMLIFIVPIFSDMFESLDSELPAMTQLLVVLSENMLFIGPATVGVVLALFFGYRKIKHRTEVRQVVDSFKLKMPIFGSLFQKIAIGRFSRNLAMMLNAGVPLLDALPLVKTTTNNYIMEKAIDDVQRSVKRGNSFASPLAAYNELFPPLATNMIATGEESGNIATMLDEVAEYYEEEVAVATDSLSAMMEPIMIVVLGVIIGGMVIALYLPMFSMFEVIGEQ